MADTQQLLQMPVFYKPDPNSQQVYNAQGQAVSYEQYLAEGGQPDFSNVQPTQPPATSQVDSSSIWNLPGASALRNTMSPADQAFVESLYKVSQSQIASGGVGSFDPQTFNKALQLASTDPTIKSTYGDAATVGAKDLAFSLGQITNNQMTAQPALQASLVQQQKDLQDQIAQAGQAYSGFRKQAEQQLQAQQADVIQSSRSQLQQQIQQLGRGYETTFGSTALNQQPPITAGGAVTGMQSYTPVGGVTGTNVVGQQQAETTKAQDYLPQVSSTGILK